MTHRSQFIASLKCFRFWLKDWGLSLRRRKSFSLLRKIDSVSGIYLPLFGGTGNEAWIWQFTCNCTFLYDSAVQCSRIAVRYPFIVS